MTVQKAEDVKDTALKLDEIRTQHPEDYFYLKGWIHCLLQKSKLDENQRKSPKQLVQTYTKSSSNIQREHFSGKGVPRRRTEKTIYEENKRGKEVQAEDHKIRQEVGP